MLVRDTIDRSGRVLGGWAWWCRWIPCWWWSPHTHTCLHQSSLAQLRQWWLHISALIITPHQQSSGSDDAGQLNSKSFLNNLCTVSGFDLKVALLKWIILNEAVYLKKSTTNEWEQAGYLQIKFLIFFIYLLYVSSSVSCMLDIKSLRVKYFHLYPQPTNQHCLSIYDLLVCQGWRWRQLTITNIKEQKKMMTQWHVHFMIRLQRLLQVTSCPRTHQSQFFHSCSYQPQRTSRKIL